MPEILLRASRDKHCVFLACIQADTGHCLSIASTQAHLVRRGTHNTLMAGSMLYLLDAGESDRLLGWIDPPSVMQGAQT